MKFIVLWNKTYIMQTVLEVADLCNLLSLLPWTRALHWPWIFITIIPLFFTMTREPIIERFWMVICMTHYILNFIVQGWWFSMSVGRTLKEATPWNWSSSGYQTFSCSGCRNKKKNPKKLAFPVQVLPKNFVYNTKTWWKIMDFGLLLSNYYLLHYLRTS